MTGGAEASVIWQTTGKCPSVVKVDTPIGKTLYLDIIPREFGVCGVVKDAGDDPDVTNGSEIIRLSCLRKRETFPFSEEKESALSRRKD